MIFLLSNFSDMEHFIFHRLNMFYSWIYYSVFPYLNISFQKFYLFVPPVARNILEHHKISLSLPHTSHVYKYWKSVIKHILGLLFLR